MPRGTKRKAEEAKAVQVPDPQAFADEFCARRGLIPAELIGTSPVEKKCADSAEQARQLYKDHRDDEIDRSRENFDDDDYAKKRRPNVAPDEAGLTPAQKYARRLFNNRKSAAASRVYQEVLRREQAHILHLGSPSPASDYKHLRDTVVKKIEDERDALKAANEVLKSALHTERRLATQLRIQELRRKQFKSEESQDRNDMKYLITQLIADTQTPEMPHNGAPNHASASQDERLLGPHHAPALHMSPQEFDLVNADVGSGVPQANQTQQSCDLSQPSISGSVFLNDSQPSAHAHAESQIHQDVNDHQAVSRTNSRLVTQKWPNSMGLSQVANEADAKEFTTGMTCTQSQNEDEKDGMRSSLPMSSALLLSSQPGSQPSQMNLPSFKSHMVVSSVGLGDPEYFLDSQNSGGNAK